MGASHCLCVYGVLCPVGSQAMGKGRLLGECRGTRELAEGFEA